MPAIHANIDLNDINFGPCKMIIGYASIEGECATIGGCSRTAHGVDYSTYFYDSKQECKLATTRHIDHCPDNSTYSSCGTACPPTCENPMPEACILVCVEGCFCDGNSVWHDANTNHILDEDECIAPDQCPITCSNTMGDINNDNSLNVLDIVLIVNCLLESGQCVCADANNDDQVDITDIVTLVNQILNTNCTLSDGAEVEHGWTGSGTDDNWCNHCFCENGMLGCTEMACEMQEYGSCTLSDGTEVETGWTGSGTGDNWCNHCFCGENGMVGCTLMYCGDCINQEAIDDTLLCAEEEDLVCGCDGKTYGNSCLANAKGVTSWTEGECSREVQTCVLQDNITAVEHGWSGNGTGDNWCNSCFCNDSALACTKMGCPTQNETNTLNRDCIDTDLIEPLMACTRQYAPVCGCDDQTYSNACRAESAGLTSWTEGECTSDSETHPSNDPSDCCKAMTASCLACRQQLTIEAYCLENLDTVGCPDDALDLFS